MSQSKIFTEDRPEILVTDDSVDSLKMLTAALTEEGYLVRPTSNGELALASVAEKAPDLILLDVKMPGLDGYEVCRQLKSEETSRSIPVIFISGLDEAIDKVKAFEVGGVDFITKPLQLEEVLARVKTQLNLKRMQADLERSRDELEVRVRQRTQELETANFNLKKEIKERQQTELELRESEDRFRSTFEQAAVGIAHSDPSGRLLRANTRFSQMVGYAKDELIGRTWSSITHPEELQENLTGIKALLNQEVEIYATQKRYIRKDTSIIWTNVTVSCVRNPDGTPKYTIAVIEDITERRRIEAQLRQAQKMQAVGTLAGGIAHDFNNILSSIIGFAELGLEDVAPGSEMEDNFEEIYIAGKRARDLVKQILAFARQTKQEVGPVRVGDICREVVKLLRATLPASIEIRQHIGSDTCIMGDVGMVHQVVMNLCTNAFHAMEKNGGILSIELTDVVLDADFTNTQPDLEPGRFLRLKVSDTGSGISPEVMDAIFDPYFTTKETGKGTGLGLSVVHGIVKSYGGTIIAKSRPGRGSQFYVYFMESDKQSEADGLGEKTMPVGSEHILFVDDERAIVKVQAQALRRLGYTVQTSTSAKEALLIFQASPDDFDLVITDMTMPQMNGDKLISEIHAIRPNMPVILCTGYSSLMSEEKAAEAGVNGFVYKPIVKQDLAQMIRRVLDKDGSVAQSTTERNP